MLRRMPELGFHAAQNVIDVSAVVALSLCYVMVNSTSMGLASDIDNPLVTVFLWEYSGAPWVQRLKSIDFTPYGIQSKTRL